MNKKRIIKIVDIVFLASIFIATFHTIYTKYNFRTIFIYGIMDTVLKSVLLVIVYFAIRFALSKAYKSKFSKIDLKNENYYKDIIHKYSPAVLKYVDNFEYGDEIIAVILMGLKLKGVINNELEIINNDLSKLDLNEKYICVNINKLKNIDMDQLKYTIIQDCKNYGLLKEYKSKGLKDFPVTLSALFWTPAIVVILGLINYMLIILLVTIIIIMVIAYVMYNIMIDEYNCRNPYIRTIKGEQLNEKLEGLKKYLADFSSLDIKTEAELVLWEDYLIYSVIFNQNGKIVKEYQEKIDRM